VERTPDSRAPTPIALGAVSGHQIITSWPARDGAGLPSDVFVQRTFSLRSKAMETGAVHDRIVLATLDQGVFANTAGSTEVARCAEEPCRGWCGILVYDEHLPRRKWQLGRVTQVFPDAHGKVRQVQIMTGSSSFRRGNHALPHRLVSLNQWLPNVFEPLPKSRYRLCLITLNKKFSHFRSKISFCSDRS